MDLLFANCRQYNGEGDPVRSRGEELSAVFAGLWQEAKIEQLLLESTCLSAEDSLAPTLSDGGTLHAETTLLSNDTAVTREPEHAEVRSKLVIKDEVSPMDVDDVVVEVPKIKLKMKEETPDFTPTPAPALAPALAPEQPMALDVDAPPAPASDGRTDAEVEGVVEVPKIKLKMKEEEKPLLEEEAAAAAAEVVDDGEAVLVNKESIGHTETEREREDAPPKAPASGLTLKIKFGAPKKQP